jgi:hypothetical protein
VTPPLADYRLWVSTDPTYQFGFTGFRAVGDPAIGWKGLKAPDGRLIRPDPYAPADTFYWLRNR